MHRILMLIALLFTIPAKAVVNIDWVTVGDPENDCEGQTIGDCRACP